ncbi:MAG: glutamate--tRNA ligase [Candidatus Yanofskybacteria bacterium]|nr:glutamate--tRNA ligase [Candidatus Yanofskybacteria bacterium]
MTKVRKPEIRVRVAPSPTGNLHIGNARTALFNWLFAKHHTGKLILRIEDTDLERSSLEFEKNILNGLEWLGLKWDEFYKQSERLDRYEKHLKKLLEEKKAFWCYHSKEELEAEKKEQTQKKEAPRHICEHKYMNHESGIMNQGAGIIRLKVDENSHRTVRFEDIIRGHVEFEQRVIGDLSLAKDLRTPLYNFAVVVDDHEMKISHVIRGEDHIANTPKQILIAEALGVSLPQFAHLPLILGEDRSKLSKRHGAVNFDEYIGAGYLPEALVNFLSLLGWSSKDGREILTKNEIIEQFSLEKVHKSGAIFDVKKLNWINSQYIKQFNDEGLTSLVMPFIEKYFGKQDKVFVLKLAPVFRERLEYLDQVKEFKYFFGEPEYEADILVWKKSDKEKTHKALESVLEILSSNLEWEIFDEKYIRSELDKLAEEKFGGDRGAVYWPLRVALTGEKFSPDPVEIARIIGKEKTLNRIQVALKKP